jgi:hypothetical protein
VRGEEKTEFWWENLEDLKVDGREILKYIGHILVGRGGD